MACGYKNNTTQTAAHTRHRDLQCLLIMLSLTMRFPPRDGGRLRYADTMVLQNFAELIPALRVRKRRARKFRPMQTLQLCCVHDTPVWVHLSRNAY